MEAVQNELDRHTAFPARLTAIMRSFANLRLPFAAQDLSNSKRAPKLAKTIGSCRWRRHGREEASGWKIKLVVFLLSTLLPIPDLTADWPQFRGPGGLGIAAEADPPVHFGPSTNVLFSIELPAGNSSPIISGNRILLTGREGGNLLTMAFDKRTGKNLWTQEFSPGRLEPFHASLGSPSSSTPVTDGTNVYVYFGSFGLMAYSLEGAELWRKPLVEPILEFGASTSPILAGGKLILQSDQDMNSALLGIDPRTGKTLWKTDRSEFPRAFGSPFLWQNELGEELVVPGTLYLTSYDPASGQELWRARAQSRVVCTSPVAGEGLLFAASWTTGGDSLNKMTLPPFQETDLDKDGVIRKEEIPAGPIRDRFAQIDFDKDKRITPAEWAKMTDIFARVENSVVAIRPGGRGDITDTHLLWKRNRGTPYVPSPLYYKGRLYTVKNGGLFSCFDAKTGQPYYEEERLGAIGDYYSSPIVANGRIYVISQTGTVVVVAAGDTLSVLARNPLGEQTLATPAAQGKVLYVRTARHLHAFSERP